MTDSRTAASPVFTDAFGRQITYLRLSVTDRCNLRCHYCMPEGMTFLPKEMLLSYEEMLRLVGILAGNGVEKVRITGGEPFVRREVLGFLTELKNIDGLGKRYVTTNGVVPDKVFAHLPDLALSGVNLSLDSLDRARFARITRRDRLGQVLAFMDRVLDLGIPLKINVVVMSGQNEADLIPLANLTRELPVTVRFIEEMPFNGNQKQAAPVPWHYRRIEEYLGKTFPGLVRQPQLTGSTELLYRIPGHRGEVGIIAGYSRTFCGTCNRLRVNARGEMRTCLYGKKVLDLRRLMRSGAGDAAIAGAIAAAVAGRFADGWSAQQDRDRRQPHNPSMSVIGG